MLSDPETRKRYDRFGEDFRRFPRTGKSGQPLVPVASAAQGRSGARVRYGQASAVPAAASTSKTFRRHVRRRWRIRADSGRRPGSGAGADRRRGLPGRQTATLTGWPQLRGQHPAGVIDGQRIRLAGEGGRGNGDATGRRPLSAGAHRSRIPNSVSTDAMSPSICRCRPGRRCWEPLSRCGLPAAKRSQGAARVVDR